MSDTYNKFSKYFREIIKSTGHLEKEDLLMSNMAAFLNFKKTDLILDAACGTGDALSSLYCNGYKNVEGLDYSINMILKSKEILPNIPYYNCSWEQLNTAKINKKYNLIYIIGTSLLHVAAENVPLILESIYHLLLPVGIFVFDIRRWGDSDENGVIQKNRPINKYKKVCEFELDGIKYLVHDKCTYTKERQHIRYKINLQNKPDIEPSYYDVSYARLSANDFIKELKKVGFKEIEIREENNWPYTLILAYK